MVNIVKRTFVSLFYFILRICKRAHCCFKRRRRMSIEPARLTNIGIVSDKEKETDLKSWEAWEDPLTIITTTKPIDPVSKKIELYRQQKIAASQENIEDEPKIDYFQDMTPKIIKQTKVLLFSEESEKSSTTASLSFAPDPAFNLSELGVWEDSQTWEDQTEQDWDVNVMLREKKKIDRERKLAEQQKKKFDCELRMGKNLSATKAS